MGWLLLSHCKYWEATEHPNSEISEVVNGHTMQRPRRPVLRKAVLAGGGCRRDNMDEKERATESTQGGKVREMGEAVQSTECAGENMEVGTRGK